MKRYNYLLNASIFMLASSLLGTKAESTELESGNTVTIPGIDIAFSNDIFDFLTEDEDEDYDYDYTNDDESSTEDFSALRKKKRNPKPVKAQEAKSTKKPKPEKGQNKKGGKKKGGKKKGGKKKDGKKKGGKKQGAKKKGEKGAIVFAKEKVATTSGGVSVFQAAARVSPTISPAPTKSPTDAPTSFPTRNPTPAPTSAPTNKPTSHPTDSPTGIHPTISPAPTKFPTKSPTSFPTRTPTKSPTNSPTFRPTASPTSSTCSVIVTLAMPHLGALGGQTGINYDTLRVQKGGDPNDCYMSPEFDYVNNENIVAWGCKISGWAYLTNNVSGERSASSSSQAIISAAERAKTYTVSVENVDYYDTYYTTDDSPTFGSVLSISIDGVPACSRRYNPGSPNFSVQVQGCRVSSC